MEPRARRIVATAIMLGLLCAVTPAAGQDCPRCTESGEAPDALPGILDVPIAELRPEISGGVTLSGGYGVSVDEPWARTTRHRLAGAIAGAIHVQPWLAIGASITGRWESIERGNADTGMIGLPALTARLTVEPIERLGLALDVSAWMHGAEAPSLEPASTSLRARAVGSYRVRLDPGTALTITATAGGILDNSRAAAPRSVTDALSDADRLSLGISDFSGVLVGAGGALRLGAIELLAEATYRILIGDGAPPAAAMPIHVVLGARVRPIGELLELGAYADLSAGEARPEPVERGRPAAPIDPRITLSLVASLRLGVGGESVAVFDGAGGGGEDAGAAGGHGRGGDAGDPAAPGSIRGRVLDDAGAAIAGASIEVTPAGSAPDAEPLRASSGEDGGWSLTGVASGPARIVIRVEGREPLELTAEVGAGAATDLAESRVARALPRGEIRGVVQGHDGAPLPAEVRIEPIGVELVCDADGAFEAEVPPGRYRVTVRAPGHRPQTREVEVVLRGVVVLNAQLHRQR